MPNYEIHCREKHGPHLSNFDAIEEDLGPYDAAVTWARSWSMDGHMYPIVVFVRHEGAYNWLRIAVHLEHVPTFSAKFLHGDSPRNEADSPRNEPPPAATQAELDRLRKIEAAALALMDYGENGDDALLCLDRYYDALTEAVKIEVQP